MELRPQGNGYPRNAIDEELTKDVPPVYNLGVTRAYVYSVRAPQDGGLCSVRRYKMLPQKGANRERRRFGMFILTKNDCQTHVDGIRELKTLRGISVPRKPRAAGIYGCIVNIQKASHTEEREPFCKSARRSVKSWLNRVR